MNDPQDARGGARYGRHWWRSIGASARPAVRLLEVRLRIPAALLIAALVVGRWDVIRNHWDKLTRVRAAENAAMGVVSNDTEYFCPMDPGVVSSWPSRCGVCNMALVVRRKGEAAMLPDGVVARMQVSPYRVQLAGILTQAVEFRPLVRDVPGAGVIRRENGQSLIDVDLARIDALSVREGTRAEVRWPALAGREPFGGSVVALGQPSEDDATARVRVAVEDRRSEIPAGGLLDVRFLVPVSELEPFRSEPAGPPARRPGEARDVYVCPEHGESISTEPGRCPVDRKPRRLVTLADVERLRWWCPMHPKVIADRPNATCEACGGMALTPRIVTFRPQGKALAVPESAVVETGARTVVFVESMPGTFDAVEVVLGPRCGSEYPVVRGLEPGQKVVIAGAFLLDAETRLNPSVAAAYFGAARDRARGSAGPQGSKSTGGAETNGLDSLSLRDREAAERQRVCPVTRKPLGSMGTPVPVVLGKRVVYLCCEGCEERLRSEPARFLARLQKPATP